MTDARIHLRIEDYALVGNTHSCALVGNNGSVDWLCMPHFDSPACFAALLGTIDNGRWLIAPHSERCTVRRRYQGETLILETEFETDEGVVAVIDFMPCADGDDRMDLVRVVEGRRGCVAMQTDLVMRFDYGLIKPWVRKLDGGITGIAGPDAVQVITPVDLHGEDFHTRAAFTVNAGETVPFVLTWHRSHTPSPPPLDWQAALDETREVFSRWAAQTEYEGPYREAVVRSLLTLKALTFAPTGGIVAAPTTSLPEKIGGVRNWDYRYCWLRDATLTLYAFLTSGYKEEAEAWRQWLLRAVAGEPSQLQVLYGIDGRRRLPEFELPWLSGYEHSSPVRVGNGASGQLQIDIYGEVIDAAHAARHFGLDNSEDAWRVQKTLLHFLEVNWDQPDEGIWEVRGGRRHFVHSKVMAWVAFDRAVKAVEFGGMDGPVDRWHMLRDRIHEDVCRKGWNPSRHSFVQSYGSNDLDAALLMIPLTGFLPVEDPRVKATVSAIEHELMDGGLLLRYRTDSDTDGLPTGEGAFLACSFWLADVMAMQGRHEEAQRLFEHLLSLRNDVGLLAEEYDVRAQRQLGNFPQAFSHIGLVNTAHALSPRHEVAPAQREPGGKPHRAAEGREPETGLIPRR